MATHMDIHKEASQETKKAIDDLITSLGIGWFTSDSPLSTDRVNKITLSLVSLSDTPLDKPKTICIEYYADKSDPIGCWEVSG